MDRKAVAEMCEQIEYAGGSVREYLHELGFISPWGTWFRLQREQLGRKDWQIRDGKECRAMGKSISLEQKKKAVEIALAGGNPLPYLRECGSKKPDGLWYVIKKNLKEVDPEKYARLPARVNSSEPKVWKPTEEERPVTTCCARSTREGAEVPDELPEEGEPVKPEVVLTIKSEDLTRASDETPHMESITKPLNYDGFEVTGLKTAYGEFRISCNGFLYFGGMEKGDELEMPVEVWRKFAADLPRVMAILGVPVGDGEQN